MSGKLLAAAAVAVVAQHDVLFNGVLYGPGRPEGDAFMVPEAQARGLEAVGAVKRSTEDAARQAEEVAVAEKKAADEAEAAKKVEEVASANAGASKPAAKTAAKKR